MACKPVKLERRESSAADNNRFIVAYLYQLQSNKEVMIVDVMKMITIGVERGNNLKKIEENSTPTAVNEIKRLTKAYNLVSHSNTKYAVTLSRICDAFAWLTCHYLHTTAINPTVSFTRMESICKNYPRAMMNSAFAYLIPNKADEFCTFLKKAHMLHQYEFNKTISGQRFPKQSESLSILSNVLKYTQAAINGSFISYDAQIGYLKKFDVISENENEIIVTEQVLAAVKVWEKMERTLPMTSTEYSGRLDSFEDFSFYNNLDEIMKNCTF